MGAALTVSAIILNSFASRASCKGSSARAEDLAPIGEWTERAWSELNPSSADEYPAIGSSKINDEINGKVRILKKTKTLVFLFCELSCNNKILASASGIWKMLKAKS